MAKRSRSFPEFTPEEEKLLYEVGEVLQKAEGETSVISLSRLMQFRLACGLLQQAVDNTHKFKIWTDENKPFVYFSSVTVESTDIVIKDMKKFRLVCRLADNFDVTPTTHGKIQMSFGFYGMTEVI